MSPLHFKNTLRGSVVLPASKSISARVLFINALSDTPCPLKNLAQCDDTAAMLRAAENNTLLPDEATRPVPSCKGSERTANSMADLFATTEDTTSSTPSAPHARAATASSSEQHINIGAAGTAMRFATALLATRQGRQYILSGTERMHQRPIGPLVDALNSLGADIQYVNQAGFPPLKITGRVLTGTTVEISAEVSSQYISALLMLGPVLPHGLQIRLRGDIISRPYIDLTLSVMSAFGAKGMWIGENTIFVQPGGYRRTTPLYVETDWSAASYWYELVALSPDKDAAIQLSGLRTDSIQGDSRVADFFEPLGVKTTFSNESVWLTKQPAQPDYFCRLDLAEQPDLAQTLVVTCAMLGVPFHFTGLQSLRIKETDRINALECELAKFGIKMQARLAGELLWDAPGTRPVQTKDSIAIDTYNDHRMAMAFAPCAMKHPGLIINNPEVVSKSYPLFWEHLKPFLSL